VKLREFLGIDKRTPVMEKNLNMPLRKFLRHVNSRIKNKSTYLGVRAIKNPMDFWVYQEIIWRVKPEVIVEVGTCYGGGTLALAHLQDIMDLGRVITVDVDHSQVAAQVLEHPRITAITGDACESFAAVKELIGDSAPVLVIEDSSHTYENTLNVLRKYHTLVTADSYLIVEDSDLNHGVPSGIKPGPYEAIETFMNENDDFAVDRSMEAFIATSNPKGYLRRT
jgi:cephalosporin hydroxylase